MIFERPLPSEGAAWCDVEAWGATLLSSDTFSLFPK